MVRYLVVVITYLTLTKCDSTSSNDNNYALPKYENNIESTKGDLKAYEYFGRYQESDIDKRYFNWTEKYSDEYIKYLDEMYGFTGPTANDEPENLMRPCSLQDWECIRKYFAANSKCKPAYGPIPDPIIFDVMTVFYPIGNMTVAYPDGQIRGLSSAKISDFYFNKKSGNLVFAFDVENLNQTLPRAYYRYRRTAKESIVLGGFATINYRTATFTAVIPKKPDLRLDLADVHLTIQDGAPPYFLSPELAASDDPDVQSAFVQFAAATPLSVREGVFFEAQIFASLYIQKSICDFGLKLISN